MVGSKYSVVKAMPMLNTIGEVMAAPSEDRTFRSING